MSSINYQSHGEGRPIVLIHGFPLNLKIWDQLIPELSGYRVLTVDLPGFGQSTLSNESFTINDIGRALIDWLQALNIERPVLVGHSLGGYVALSMLSQWPQGIGGVVLLHSAALADSPEKKESRNKVLQFIEDHGVSAFTSNFVQPLFADPQHPAIGTVREIAMEAQKNAVTGYTKAMRDRPDRMELIQQTAVPLLLIAGAKDSVIPPETVEKHRVSSVGVAIVEETGHMGMYENPKQVGRLIKTFAGK